ncbi:Ctf8 family protein [Aspergillus chevalieri]|uniref:Sister chromatid cohesion protein Ctf8 n=1 Tax=Aspergillus chevalieri TaxID=182096 RepID=A0A7R7VEL8_ASPCH|nr:uncharacterized protein ACHE_10797A [Aspergillus chevalieri]BCR83395.1 hypothetical protein ACHE_10797A [Aspergillus chevalieri]
MPSIPLHPRAISPSKPHDNPLPNTLQTPSGLALLELQGTINFPSTEEQQPDKQQSQDQDQAENGAAPTATDTTYETPLGKLMFPDYSPQTTSNDDTSWMKRVYLYVGRYQRMTGEVKKLPQPIAVVQRRGETDELEILEVVKFKMIFKSRPEPVNDS